MTSSPFLYRPLPIILLPLLTASLAFGQGRFAQMEQQNLAEDFVGVTTDGTPKKGLFELKSTGVSTEPMREAALAWIATLTEEQREATLFPVDDEEWRKWANMHSYKRQGTSFEEMTEAQRDKAFELLGAALSAKGLQLTRDIMRLNETLKEMVNKPGEYGEGLYWITIMGEPSATEPWGFQLDGHHAILNYFVLGDQVVMSPAFYGSEPIRATSGKYKGTVILQAEQDEGVALVRSLSEEQQAKAILSQQKDGANNLSEAFKDNIQLEYAGIRAAELSKDQQEDLVELIGLFVGNMREGHAKVRMSQVVAHLDDTYFAWIGSTETDGVFYYRIHSPVILIEFDHQRPIAFERTGIPSRDHIHSVVRTPNGNDYGKDLLRQHYEKHPH